MEAMILKKAKKKIRSNYITVPGFGGPAPLYENESSLAHSVVFGNERYRKK